MFSLLLIFSCLFHFFSFAPMYSRMQVLTSALVILPSPLVSRGSLAAMVWPRARQISVRSYLSMSPSASTSQVSGATPLPLSTMTSSCIVTADSEDACVCTSTRGFVFHRHSYGTTGVHVERQNGRTCTEGEVSAARLG